jgi:hypothetical protein
MILNYIKTWADNSKTAQQIAWEMSADLWRNIDERYVRKQIKENRNKWIVWNNKGSYIEPNQTMRDEFIKKRVVSAMYWFTRWMNNVATNLWWSTWLDIINK